MAHATSSNPNDFILPDLGEGVHEAELISWKVQVGQQVDEHDILAEMETDKALVEVPSPRAGTIAKLWGEEGQIMNVGKPLVSYEGEGDETPETTTAAATQKAAPTTSSNGSATKADADEQEDAGTVVGSMSGTLGAVSGGDGKVLAAPAVRRLARDMGIDLAAVQGTGIAGRVTEKDVRAAASGSAQPKPQQPTAAPKPTPSAPTPGALQQPAATQPSPTPSLEPASFPAGEATQTVPFRGVRRTIANRLRESMDKAVHFNVMDEADVTDLDALRKRLASASGEKVSFLPFVASALCRVLTAEQFRIMNARVDDDNEQIVQHRAVHMGIATDTDTGLMVPVIRDCDALGVLEISRHVSHIAKAARDRSIPREQLMGSTFTISNVGSHAGRFATPVINYPEVGILAVGRAREGVVTKGGWFRVGKQLPLSLACDHRVVDGATAAMALAKVVELLQSPEQLLTPARAS